jgi:drug/metabolite transporter (DMT)-like permease
MTEVAQNHRVYGLAVTLLGVAFFFPDALIVRLIGADMMTVAVWRGLVAAGVTLAVAAFLPGVWPSWRDLLSWPSLAMAGLQGVGSVFFLVSLGQTSAANALLILATAPFLAALLSWLVLGEGITRATVLAIAAVFAGVGIIASGSVGGGTLLGDGLALANAVTLAFYYVVLRKVPDRNMIVPIALGYLVTSAIAFPLAPMEPLNLVQAGLILVSGGVILAGGAALLMLGPRYLPAAEVSMITMLEIVVGPLLVWAVLGEVPSVASLIGGAVILTAITVHAGMQLATARN